MAWNTHPSVVTGLTWSASDQNTYVKGNLDTLFPYTSPLQIAYSTSSATLAVATASAALQVVRVNATNTAIEFGTMPIVYRRQGYSTASWGATSSSTVTPTNYTPSNSFMQVGAVPTSASTASITFPVAYTVPPIVIAHATFDSTTNGGYVKSVSSTGFVFVFPSTDFLFVNWIALGE